GDTNRFSADFEEKDASMKPRPTLSASRFDPQRVRKSPRDLDGVLFALNSSDIDEQARLGPRFPVSAIETVSQKQVGDDGHCKSRRFWHHGGEGCRQTR